MKLFSFRWILLPFLICAGSIPVISVICYKCIHARSNGKCDSLSHSYVVRCPPNFTCTKELYYIPEKGIVDKPAVVVAVERNCIGLDETIMEWNLTNSCIRSFYPPYVGRICYCNDKDLCNGGAVSNHSMPFLIIQTSVLIVYLQTWSIIY